MQEQMHYKKSVFCLTISVILIILIIPVESFSQEINSNLLRLNRQLTLFKDSVTLSDNQPKAQSPLKGILVLQLALGHHDNLTKAKSWNGPEAKTSDTYLKAYIEFGAAYKRISSSFFVSYILPLPRTQTFSGWEHNGEAAELGLWSHVRLLSMHSKVNFIPVVGAKWLREIASIRDSKNQNPDSLNLKYDDGAVISGIEFQYKLFEASERTEYRLILGYLHEFLRQEVDRYRVEFRWIEFPYVGERIVFDQHGFLSLGFENIRWAGDRSGWFIIASFGVELR